MPAGQSLEWPEVVFQIQRLCVFIARTEELPERLCEPGTVGEEGELTALFHFLSVREAFSCCSYLLQSPLPSSPSSAYSCVCSLNLRHSVCSGPDKMPLSFPFPCIYREIFPKHLEPDHYKSCVTGLDFGLSLREMPTPGWQLWPEWGQAVQDMAGPVDRDRVLGQIPWEEVGWHRRCRGYFAEVRAWCVCGFSRNLFKNHRLFKK